MDIIDQLIKSLQEAKEALAKDAANPKLAPKEVKIKQLQGQIDAGTYKPDPKKIAGAMLKDEAEPHKDDPHHEAKEKKIASKIKSKAEDLLDMHKMEEMYCSENGQWNIKMKGGR